MGLKYGCPVEDVITGLSIQCLGWKSVYLNPAQKAFLGVAPTTLEQTLVQHKRWSEGDLQILLSKYSPAWYGLGRISPGLILGYCTYCLWPLNSLATLSYCIVPSLYLLHGIPLFPQVNSHHFLHIFTPILTLLGPLWSKLRQSELGFTCSGLKPMVPTICIRDIGQVQWQLGWVPLVWRHTLGVVEWPENLAL